MSSMPIAFFDVDETLIHPKSMFALLRFYLVRKFENRGAELYKEIWDEVRSLAEADVSRQDINRHYYRLWKGERVSDVESTGRDWVASELAAGNFLISSTIDALREHRNIGYRTVLVSGSFPAALKPIADLVGADEIICTRPLSKNGCMTGEIEIPMIGINKAKAAIELMNRLGSDPATCAAYGDHISDLDLLELVGQPGIVPHDPELLAIAKARNWRILS